MAQPQVNPRPLGWVISMDLNCRKDEGGIHNMLSGTMLAVLPFILFLVALLTAMYSIVSRRQETVSGGASLPAKLVRVEGGYEIHPPQHVEWSDTKWVRLSGMQKAARWVSILALALAFLLGFQPASIVVYAFIVGTVWVFKMHGDWIALPVPFVGAGIATGIIFYLLSHDQLTGIGEPLLYLGPPVGALIGVRLIDKEIKILKVFGLSVVLNFVGFLVLSFLTNSIEGFVAFAVMTIASGIGALLGSIWSVS